ncbi:SpoIID/LytB domain-containing protein [Nocardioides nanhaiensis]|uniref:SpoIID/LytB domain-containing protein n=1 Tax=Nocardioides nanhaiensis TaxID=1476871 RepID=UPI0031E4E759
MRRLGSLLLVAALAGVAAPAAADAVDDSPRAPAVRAERAAPAISVLGNGYGHGRGLSQHGAQSRALDGQGHRAIVEHYYPGTTWGSARGKVLVQISADTTRDVVVAPRRGLVASAVRGGERVAVAKVRPRATRFRLLPVQGGTRVQALQGGWRTLRTLPGAAEFRAQGQPVTLFVTPRTRVSYRGALRAAGGDTVNVVSLEDYLRGVVPQEVPALWHPEAVRAQSVAARTYAAFERAQPLAAHYQICDTSQCQVYGGASAEHPASDAAIAATAGQVLLSGGRPAFTQFSASNGGWSVAGSQPYLRAAADPFDTAYRGWTASIDGAAVSRAYPAIGAFTGATVTRRDGNGRWGGRPLAVRLTGTQTSTTVSGETFRSVFGLRSSYFTLR